MNAQPVDDDAQHHVALWTNLLTTTEAAKRLGIGRTSLYALLDKGELRSLRIGTSRRVAVGAIEEFIRNRMTPASDRGEPTLIGRRASERPSAAEAASPLTYQGGPK